MAVIRNHKNLIKMLYEYQITCIFIKDFFFISAISPLRTFDTLTSFHGDKIQNTYFFLLKKDKYVFCEFKFGILILGVVLVLHQKAVEIGLSLDFV